jgi:hypothetical protein
VIRFLFPMIPMDKVIVPDYVVSPSMVHLMEMQKRKCPWSDCTEPFDQNESLNNEAAQVERIVSDHVRSLGTPPLFLRGTSTIKDPNGLTMGKGPVRVGMRLESPLEDSPLFSVTMDAHLTAVVTAWKAMLASDAQVTLNLFFQLLWYHAGCFKETERLCGGAFQTASVPSEASSRIPCGLSFLLPGYDAKGRLVVGAGNHHPAITGLRQVGHLEMSAIKLVCMDVDGTLLGDDHIRIPDLNRVALQKAFQKGLHLALVSGRLSASLRPIQQNLGITGPLGCFGGALVVDERDQILDQHPSPKRRPSR